MNYYHNNFSRHVEFVYNFPIEQLMFFIFNMGPATSICLGDYNTVSKWLKFLTYDESTHYVPRFFQSMDTVFQIDFEVFFCIKIGPATPNYFYHDSDKVYWL